MKSFLAEVVNDLKSNVVDLDQFRAKLYHKKVNWMLSHGYTRGRHGDLWKEVPNERAPNGEPWTRIVYTSTMKDLDTIIVQDEFGREIDHMTILWGPDFANDIREGFDPEQEKQLEAAIKAVEKMKDLASAKQLARDAINKLQWKEKATKYLNGIDKATTVARVLQIVYNVKLAGEGLKVIK